MDTTQRIKSMRKQELVDEYLAFRQKVKQGVLEHPDKGCDEGARDFLKEIGLQEDELVAPPVVVEVRLTVSIPAYDRMGYESTAGGVKEAILWSGATTDMASSLDIDENDMEITVVTCVEAS